MPQDNACLNVLDFRGAPRAGDKTGEMGGCWEVRAVNLRVGVGGKQGGDARL